MHTDRGFYSIELISCLVVTGILMAIAIPRFMSTLKRRELKTEAEALKDTTEHLIAQARQTSTKLSLLVSRESYAYTSLHGETPQQVVHLFKSGIVSNKNDPHTISFYPSGVTSPAAVTLTEGSYSCTVTLSLRGRITVSC